MEAAESVPHHLLFSPETCSYFNHVAECLLLDLLTGSCTGSNPSDFQFKALVELLEVSQ